MPARVDTRGSLLAMAVDSGHRLIRQRCATSNIFIAPLFAANGTRESGVASAFGLRSLHK